MTMTPAYTKSRILQRARYRVVEAPVGADGPARHVDLTQLVALDVMLPDGPDVCRIINFGERN